MALKVTVSVTAPVNIAVIKYWGKRDGTLILPLNSSLSATIHQGSMRSATTVTASKEYKEDHMLLNDKEVSLSKDKRLLTVLQTIRARAKDLRDERGSILIGAQDWPLYKLRIVSQNNFPTAAGLASSASGLAAFAFSLANLYGYEEGYAGELSTIARQGSGSACRSMYGGWVKWNMGVDDVKGKDSIAVQVADENHWPEMRILILVAGAHKKDTSSTIGMETTTQTSPLIQYRVKELVPERMLRMEKAIKEKDFQTFGKLTIQDSNQFHAVCLDTYPPLFYLNEGSKRVISLINTFNAQHQGIVAAYTFDAGPNAVVYTLQSHFDLLLSFFRHYFEPHSPSPRFLEDKLNLASPSPTPSLPLSKLTSVAGPVRDSDRSIISSIILTKVGPGPLIVSKTISDGSKTSLRSRL